MTLKKEIEEDTKESYLMYMYTKIVKMIIYPKASIN